MFHKEKSSTISYNGKKRKDTPLRKSDRRRLRKEVDGVIDTSACSELVDKAFLQGSLVSRTLQVKANLKATLYFRSPSETVINEESEKGILTDWPYTTQDECLWMELDESPGKITQVPSLALLSILSPKENYDLLMNTVLVRDPTVSLFLCRGADLMKAGIRSVRRRVFPDETNPTSSPVVAIVVPGNPQAIAVGILHSTLLHGPTSSSLAGKGVGVTICSCYGDDFWHEQCPSRPPQRGMTSPHGGGIFDAGHYGNVGFVHGKEVLSILPTNSPDTEEGGVEEEPETQLKGNEQSEGEEESGDAKGSLRDTKESSVAVDNGDEEPYRPSQDEMLHESVCRALVNLSPKKDLPMTVANFYAQHVLSHRPEGTTLQLKQTKYKKFGPYLAEQVRRGLLRVGPDASGKDPTGMLVDFDKRHIELRAYAAEAKANPTSSLSASGVVRLALADLYCVPHHFVSLMRLNKDEVKAVNASSEERRNTGMLTSKEMRAILDDYIVREELVDSSNSNMVNLNGPMTDALYKRNTTGRPSRLSRKDLITAWQASMETGYALVQLPGNHIVKMARGKAPAVHVEVSMRQSKKFVTRLRGIEDFGLDAAAFAKDVANRFACSASVEDNPDGRAQLRKGHVELTFQGNLGDELEALLLGDESLTSHGGAKGSTYYLPKNSIDVVLRKGVPPRKKRQPKKK